MTVQDVRSTQARDTGQAERAKLRRELSRLDTIFFLISAMVVVDTIGAIAVGGGQAFTWLVVLFVFFFIPSALASAELGAAIPDEGGAYVWVRMAFGRFAGALTSLLYWAGTPMWLGGSVAVVAMSVHGRFFGELSQPALYLFGAGFIGLATLGAVVPLRYGKWLPTSGAIGQIGLLAFFTVSVALYGARHGAHGIAVGDLTPTSATFIAVVPVLLYSFVGVELPSTAGEEMRNPRRDIPVAIARAGIGQALMYGIPILAVLVVLPAEQVTSLGGLIDAMKTVFTVYGGSVAADGSVALSGTGQLLGWASALVFIWVLLASGSAWIMGAGRAQAAACMDGGQPLDHQGRRAEVLLGRPDRLHRPDRARLPADLPGVHGPAAAPGRPGAPVPGPGRPDRGLADHRPRHRLVAAGHRLPALARPGNGRPRRLPPGRVRGPAPPVRAAGAGPAGRRRGRLHRLPPDQPAGLTVRSACRRPGRTGRPTVRGRTR
jgi:hypothetical protein